MYIAESVRVVCDLWTQRHEATAAGRAGRGSGDSAVQQSETAVIVGSRSKLVGAQVWVHGCIHKKSA